MPTSLLTFWHEGRGPLVKKSGRARFLRKIQNWGFLGHLGSKMAQNGHFAIKLENETYKFADFLHEGRGTLVEKTGVGPYPGKNQN